GDRARGDGLPATGILRPRDAAARPPLAPHRALAAGVGELDARRRALPVDEVDDAAPGLRLFLVVDAGVLGRDAALGADPRRLRHDEACAAPGEGAQVHEVPVRGHAVLGIDRVLAEG